MKNKNKLTEHTYMLTSDLKVLNVFEGDATSAGTYVFGKYLFDIETTPEAGESLREMLQQAVDSTRKIMGEKDILSKTGSK
jgi:hypothetical protein